jgi:hypothetical protein
MITFYPGMSLSKHYIEDGKTSLRTSEPTEPTDSKDFNGSGYLKIPKNSNHPKDVKESEDHKNPKGSLDSKNLSPFQHTHQNKLSHVH